MIEIEKLQEKLKDSRSKKVVFISHCLLNENTRYLGGATKSGMIHEIIDELKRKGIGIIQMPCPEQKAWGGVLKKEMLKVYGAKNLPYFLRSLYFNSFILRTKKIYQKIAKEITDEISDYVESGFEVVGIVGVKGSPSCGVSGSIDLKKAADFLADIDLNNIDKNKINQKFYQELVSSNSGLFIEALRERLMKKRLNISFLEHDLPEEIIGNYKRIWGDQDGRL